eukprot:gene18095-2176_t
MSAADKCRRSGKTIYPMDNPIQIGDMKFIKGHFTCASSGARLTLNNYVVSDDGPSGEKDVYHKNHVPRAAPTGEAGIDMNTQHMMNSQSVSSSAKVKSADQLAEGKGASGNAHIPDHISQAKEQGSGFSGTRLL